MRPLLLSTYDRGGGAALAALRLHRGLCAAGADSQMLVQFRSGQDPGVIGPRNSLDQFRGQMGSITERLRTRGYTLKSKDFSPQWLPSAVPGRVRALAPDIVHLHWVSYGHLSIEDIARLKAPVVWTLHDMWAFTGGCHYSGGCERYLGECGACPVLTSGTEDDLSRSIWRRKKAAWDGLDIRVIAPSRWLAERARKSALFGARDIAVIPNTIDTDLFKPGDTLAMRQLFNLPVGPKLILFGAVQSLSSDRKGARHLLAALERLRLLTADPIELVVFGQSASVPGINFPLPVHYMGSFGDEVSLAALYNAVDLVVTPSVEDNLPNVAMEALACGRPCVAFDIGGLSDLIEHERAGYLARPCDAEDLARGMLYCLDTLRWPDLSRAARAHVLASYAPNVVVGQHVALYERLIKTG
jgi:glycosyltransferase involved in cell wall biosynthesis